MTPPDTTAEPTSEDWDAWCGYAQSLVEKGDPRGAAILLEYRHRKEQADVAELADAYRTVERWWGLDGLRADGSWQFTWSRGFLDKARFRAAPLTRPQRRALVERVLAERLPAADVDGVTPEQWEGVLIDALLSHPAAGRLRGLRLHLTDYHHSARSAAVSLAGRRRDRLISMYFGYDFQHLYESGPTSTGGWIDPMDHYDEGFVGAATAAVWQSLPSLRSLTIEGALLFHWVGVDALTDLRLRGAVISDGSVLPGSEPDFVTLPGLVSLELEILPDVHGAECPIEQLDGLEAAGYPRLRNLDLGRARFDAGDHGVLAALKKSSILPQLESLRIRGLDISRYEVDGEPLAALAELAPYFAHLDLSVAGDIAVEGADRSDVDRVFPTVPWRRPQSGR
ncbi:hypothetical protein [Embleya scabrispora]|uniref:hypothetical protein n=1 Tax=Embleya scabrispora TaxID=159449 RepID=UPI0003A58BD9|nr:hypothetical protein [Embleya scabrispora]